MLSTLHICLGQIIRSRKEESLRCFAILSGQTPYDEDVVIDPSSLGCPPYP